MVSPRDESIRPNGIVFTNVTLGDCIEAAWAIRPYQISGPEWLRSDKYDIMAKSAGKANRGQLLLMLQTLLADRFKMTAHRETKERSVYALVMGRNGSKLKAAGDSDEAGSKYVDGGIAFRSTSMAGFADYLAGLDPIDRAVIDRTGLNGKFDFTLRLFEERSGMTGFDKKFAMKAGENIFTDLQDQLGLKLDPTRAPIEVLVVDHAERIPSVN